jgi:hypothetical protein
MAQLKAQLKDDQDHNNINLKYSQNTQWFSMPIAGQLFDVLVDKGS